MNYKQKLEGFNATEKYERELFLLRGLIGTGRNKRILDYGCGTGYAVNRFRELGSDVHGFDVAKINESFNYSDSSGAWDCVYFMHSLAHIPNPNEVLKSLETKEVIIITPNRDWLSKQYNPGYVPDPTVERHYSQQELIATLDFCGFDCKVIGQFGNETQRRNERIFVVAVKRS